MTLRRIRHLTKNDRVYVFITYEFRLTAEGIAFIIKNRLMIEIFVQTDQADLVEIDNESQISGRDRLLKNKFHQFIKRHKCKTFELDDKKYLRSTFRIFL